MFKRPFWAVLLLGGLTAFGLLLRRTAPADNSAALLDFTADALVICGADGTTTAANAAARQLFGPDCAGLSSSLCYPNGQRVPPGQIPLERVRRSKQSLSGTEYHCVRASGAACVLDVSAYPLPGGGAAAVLREVTALHEQQVQISRMQARQTVLCTLGRRLSVAVGLDALSRIVAEETHSVLSDLPGVQVRLYGYNPAAQILTHLASEPENRPKRPHSAAQAQPPTFAFDAGIPALWQLYVARQPCEASLSVLREAEAASMYALPLLAGGVAIGHLSASSSAADAFDDPAQREILGLLASAAALALAAPQAAELAAHSNQQQDAVREVAQAIARGSSPDSLADTATKHVTHITGGICTVSITSDKGLRVIGTVHQDDLLFPHTKLSQASLHGKAVQKAWRTQKTATQLGLENPSLEAGVWRAFAGRVGQHSVLALPLESRLGVLTVYREGASALPEAQMKFLEALAALLSLGLKPATIEAVGAD